MRAGLGPTEEAEERCSGGVIVDGLMGKGGENADERVACLGREEVGRRKEVFAVVEEGGVGAGVCRLDRMKLDNVNGLESAAWER